MKAKYATMCVSCGIGIIPGKEIVRDEAKWVHKHCASSTVDLP